MSNLVFLGLYHARARSSQKSKNLLFDFIECNSIVMHKHIIVQTPNYFGSKKNI